MTEVDCAKVERALLGNLDVGQLTATERDLYDKKRPSFDIGRLASRMMQGYYGHHAIINLAKDSRAREMWSDKSLRVGFVNRKNGTRHSYNLDVYLDNLVKGAEASEDLNRTWLIGSLLNVGDALAKFDYFDHAPELELLYHLRNGIAHGNKFNFTKAGLRRLSLYPANNRLARVKMSEIKIVPELQGQQVLFDFMEPTEALELLASIEMYLTWLCPRGRCLAHPNLTW